MLQRKYFIHWIFLILLFTSISSSQITNLCSINTPSCNCTLINNINLIIICNPTPFLTQLPTLQPNTLQTSVTQLQISSSIINTKGPLIVFPTNICSYPNVQILDLSSNNISGLLNTSQLACLGSNLLQIDLSSNSINDIDKNLFQSNGNLQTIDLSSNNLTSMPSIDGSYFVTFPSSISSMNFSFNQITNVDLWPLFVRTGNQMIIDMSYNLIQNYTNTVPISLEQFSDTPDLRYFYLNNNHLVYLSDLLLEQYGACPTVDPISAAYFIVGISNLLLTNNNLACDCQSYNIITYIQDNINGFPQIFNGTALLTEATCASPTAFSGLPYLSTNFGIFNNCIDYILPTTTDIFCAFSANDTTVTLTPPTYWPSTTTTIQYETNSSSSSSSSSSITSGSSTGSSNHGSVSSSVASSWYIILGVVLGLVVILGMIISICYLFRDKFLPKKYRSKLLNHVGIDGNNTDTSYEQIIRNSEASTEKNMKLNGIKPHRASMSTSTNGFDESTRQLNNAGNQPEQETQTNFPPIRSKPPHRRRFSTRASQPKENNDLHPTSQLGRTFSLPVPSTDVGTNTINVVKGIPISSVPPKIPSVSPNVNDTVGDTSMLELSVTSIPLTPSRRAKLLPPVKSGIYDESTNENLLNTSAGAIVTSQRQRRRSALWFRKQNQNMISPLPRRPQSEVTQKTIFDYNGSFDEDLPPIPTIESFKTKPSKPLRTVPLLNISVIPAWIDENNDQT